MKLKFGNKNPLRVIFFLYDDGTSETERKIFARIWIKRTKAELSLNCNCKIDDWDEETQRCFPNTKELKNLNYRLSDFEERIE